ncbi:uncharacterized protein LOC129341561 isoform X2 [Eublepharis macularius]|uniref:Uncharacterized protein LOC129341561 isoform X2 n=1 Tax=Eublepharis macularius TaxID=481883 RepID=A0AA97LEB5_EUBMA|nr:uncharacterized protein LOC129341561 isoform X2 [Eublepharis macularius]
MSGAGVLQEDLDRAGPSARAEDDTAEVSEVPPVAVAVDQVEPEGKSALTQTSQTWPWGPVGSSCGPTSWGSQLPHSSYSSHPAWPGIPGQLQPVGVGPWQPWGHAPVPAQQGLGGLGPVPVTPGSIPAAPASSATAGGSPQPFGQPAAFWPPYLGGLYYQPTALGSLPYRAMPFGDAALPLGDHLTPATRDKILRGEFVDVFTLLFRELEKKDKEDMDERDKERMKRRKVDRSWSNWLPGMLIYAGVLARAQPHRAAPLFQYIDIIYRGYTDFVGAAWMQYDEEFRMRAASDPTLPWDRIHQQLWLQLMAPAKPNLGDRADSGHLLHRPASTSGTRASAGQPVQPRLLCWDFAYQGVCSRKGCGFKHECPRCKGPHSFPACPRPKPRGGGYRRPVGGSGQVAPDKGSFSHKAEGSG